MPARSAPTSGATTVTSAPASAHPLALATAGASPPTITQRRPSRRRKTGWVRIRPAIVPEAKSPRNMRRNGLLRRAGDLQHLTGVELPCLADPVRPAEALHAHPVRARDVRERLPGPDAVGEDGRTCGRPAA